ncbi:MAG: hypothetical protein B6226_05810 [Candidatus Cloacimonetes bacterium 4572_65]|nr:MAG: hypothetical protein B6226_05810 [Candidatus Cloacimonetes bacterium 4572_65]
MKKSLLSSLIFPGVGSIYAKPNRWVGYIFPIIEGALLYGHYHFEAEGDSQEKAYEKYVNGENIELLDPVTQEVIYSGPRYNRDFQHVVQQHISDINVEDIYDVKANKAGFFRLDLEDTQHFYEDVGKYDKYVFGWADWYEKYAYSGNGSMTDNANYSSPIWIWDTNADDNNHHLLGNEVVNPNHDPTEGSYEPLYSDLRKSYIKMRKDAELEYDKSTYFLFGMLLNRAVSAVDAYSVVKKHNKNYLTQSNFKFNYAATIVDEQFTPMIYLSQRF